MSGDPVRTAGCGWGRALIALCAVVAATAQPVTVNAREKASSTAPGATVEDLLALARGLNPDLAAARLEALSLIHI